MFRYSSSEGVSSSAEGTNVPELYLAMIVSSSGMVKGGLAVDDDEDDEDDEDEEDVEEEFVVEFVSEVVSGRHANL